MTSDRRLEPVFYLPVPVQHAPSTTAAPQRPNLYNIPNPVIALPSLPRLPSTTFDPNVLGIRPTEIGIGLPTTLSTATPITGIHTTDQVDRTVIPHADNSSPVYPRQLRLASVEGEVLVRFVVDTLGRVEAGSIAILSTTHPLFGDAVRDWLGRTRYEPAQVGGQPVRQLVQQQIGFTIR
jgi:TonB family protein